MPTLGDLLQVFLESTGKGALHQKAVAERGGDYIAKEGADLDRGLSAAVAREGQLGQLRTSNARTGALANLDTGGSGTPEERAARYIASQEARTSDRQSRVADAQIAETLAQAKERERKPAAEAAEMANKLAISEARNQTMLDAATIKGASRPEPGTFAPVFLPDGRTIMFNAKTNRWVELPGGGRPGLNAGERRDFATGGTALEDSKYLLDLLQNPEVKGAIGPFAGIITGVQRATVGVPQNIGDVVRISQNLSDQLLRLRSGAQINEQEYSRLSKLVPNVRQPLETFTQNAEAFQNELARTLQTRFGTTGGQQQNDPAMPGPGATGAGMAREPGAPQTITTREQAAAVPVGGTAVIGGKLRTKVGPDEWSE